MDVVRDCHREGDPAVLLVTEDGRLRELHHRVRDGAEVRFVTYADQTGYGTYRRSAVMLFVTALRNVCGREVRAEQHFTVGSGFYFTLEEGVACSRELAAQICEEMKRLVARKLPFVKKTVSTVDAIRLFHERGLYDKEKLFRARMASRVNIYSLDGYVDYYFGFLAHSTSVITTFSVQPYKEGLLLVLPDKGQPDALPERTRIPEKLFNAIIEGENWASRQGIRTVGDLNEKLIRGLASEAVLTSEALQESRISEIASEIAGRSSVKFVMIAGPSSSGKTTFSQRLCVQLMAHGLKPSYVGVDNYFIDRERMQVGPDGKMDFEALSAVDVEQFNEDMMALLEGKEVKMPSFDFVQGRRVYTGERLRMDNDTILVIEGIHCLNDALSYSLPVDSRFRIYISALSQLNVDLHNRISSSDGRLLRRIIRDNRTRGTNASTTIARWDSVRDGEQRNIFPYQDSADAMFNSTLAYEIAALKVYAVPLLLQVDREDPGYLEARRLLKFLDFFIPIPSEGIPKNSLLREFIGGGCFHL